MMEVACGANTTCLRLPLRGQRRLAGRQRATLFSPAAYERRLATLYARLGVPLGEAAPRPAAEPQYESDLAEG